MAVKPPKISHLVSTIKAGRAINGGAVVFLPRHADGRLDEKNFQLLLQDTFASGLIPTVLAESNFEQQSDDQFRSLILTLTQEVAAKRPFIVGASIEGKTGEPFDRFPRSKTSGAFP
jgi:hypothetical protein